MISTLVHLFPFVSSFQFVFFHLYFLGEDVNIFIISIKNYKGRYIKRNFLSIPIPYLYSLFPLDVTVLVLDFPSRKSLCNCKQIHKLTHT